MKIGGVTPTRAEEVLVLPRNTGDLVFKAHAVLSMDEFNALCPKPGAPVRITKDGKQSDTNSASYLQELQTWANRRHAYICIKSLEPSDIEWDTVKAEKASTWENWTQDLSDGGLCAIEVQRVQQCVIDANALNEDKLKEARDAFLRGQGIKTSDASSGPRDEQPSTQSGQPASE